jgi:hypothetical protein
VPNGRICLMRLCLMRATLRSKRRLATWKRAHPLPEVPDKRGRQRSGRHTQSAEPGGIVVVAIET